MSDVLLKDEHKMIQQTAREFAQKEVAHDRLWSFYEKTKSFSS